MDQIKIYQDVEAFTLYFKKYFEIEDIVDVVLFLDEGINIRMGWCVAYKSS